MSEALREPSVRRLMAALVCLTSCATAPTQAAAKPAPGCVTTCGLRASGVDCDALQALEDSALKNFERYTDTISHDRACAAFNGWEIVEHPMSPDDTCQPYGWTVVRRLCVSGYTHLERKQIELLTTKQLLRGPLAHELAHVADYSALGHAGHCRWLQRGIKRALMEITGVWDASKPESDCEATP